MKSGMTLEEHHRRSEKQRKLLLAIAAGLALSTVGIVVQVVHSRLTNKTQIIQKMTFDDFLKDSFTVFSADEADIFRALYERSQSEFGELTNLSSEMFQKFTLSHTRLLIAQFRIYDGTLEASELLPRIDELVHPDIGVIAVRYGQQPPQRLRHIWFPDSIDNPR